MLRKSNRGGGASEYGKIRDRGRSSKNKRFSDFSGGSGVRQSYAL